MALVCGQLLDDARPTSRTGPSVEAMWSDGVAEKRG